MVLEPDDPWAAYARTVVRIERAGEPISVRAAPAGDLGPWPWPWPEPLYILTAWDPGEHRPGVEANRVRQAHLEEELRPHAVAMWRARGHDPVTGTTDEGVAVHGLAEEAVRALGARYGQEATFTWSPLEWAVVACTGSRRVVAGWSIGPPGG